LLVRTVLIIPKGHFRISGCREEEYRFHIASKANKNNLKAIITIINVHTSTHQARNETTMTKEEIQKMKIPAEANEEEIEKMKITAEEKEEDSDNSNSSEVKKSPEAKEALTKVPVNTTYIATRLDEALKGAKTVNRSSDLVPLGRDFDKMRKQLRSLIAAAKHYHTARVQVEKARMEVRPVHLSGTIVMLLPR
jgi:hypothetical protein